LSRDHKAVLSIYHDGVEYEKVELQEIGTEEGMHQMMLDKGFVLKSDEEVASIKAKGQQSKNEIKNLREKVQEDVHQKKEAIIEEQRHRAETFHGSPKGDELTRLTRRIKELRNEGGDDETIKELEQRRVKLMREEMLSRQYQLQMAEEIKQKKKTVVGNDEL
jgi:hypothetical protein